MPKKHDHIREKLAALADLIGHESLYALREPSPTRDELTRIFNVALPNGTDDGATPFRFVVVEKADLSRLVDSYSDPAQKEAPSLEISVWAAKARSAPMMIALVASHSENDETVSIEERIMSVGAAAFTVLNALQLLGYGGFWATEPSAQTHILRDGISLQKAEHVIGFIFIGTPTKSDTRERRGAYADHLRSSGGDGGSVDAGGESAVSDDNMRSLSLETEQAPAAASDTSEAAEASRPGRLTTRQRECTLLVAQGKTDWEIGKILGISRDTVHEYIEAARKKYDVRTRPQLVLAAYRNGELPAVDETDPS